VVGHSQADKEASHRHRGDHLGAAAGGGLDKPPIGELMREAGLTHGGFYKHFGSREGSSTRRSAGGSGTVPGDLDGGGLRRAAGEDPSPACRRLSEPPAPGRAGQQLRARPPSVRRGSPPRPHQGGLTATVESYLRVIEGLVDEPDRPARRRRAMLVLSALVGAVTMARAVADAGAVRRAVGARCQALLRSGRTSGVRTLPPRTLDRSSVSGPLVDRSSPSLSMCRTPLPLSRHTPWMPVPTSWAKRQAGHVRHVRHVRHGGMCGKCASAARCKEATLSTTEPSPPRHDENWQAVRSAPVRRPGVVASNLHLADGGSGVTSRSGCQQSSRTVQIKPWSLSGLAQRSDAANMVDEQAPGDAMSHVAGGPFASRMVRLDGLGTDYR